MSRRQKTQRSIFRGVDYAAINVDGKENWGSRSVFIGDCLDVMRQMNSGSVNLIYLDPPFNKKKQFQYPIGRAPDDSKGSKKIAGFKDFWSWRDIHPYEADELERHYPAAARVVHAARLTYDNSMAAYCLMMASRLIEMRRILKPTGSIYLHCDPTASHYLKLLMDAIFGKNNFRNEIVWCYSNSGRSKNKFTSKHDIILFYSKTEKVRFDYMLPVSQKYIDSHYRQKDKAGRQCRIRIDAGKKRIYYPDEGMTCNDWWTDIPSLNSVAKERIGYPTQKPLALMERIIEASSDKDDIVLDPFCGCATTLIAAEKLNRQYCGIDISTLTGKLLKKRIKDETEQGELAKGILPAPKILNSRPVRGDLENELTTAEKREHKHSLYGKQKGKCAGCGVYFPAIRNLTLDRIVPGKSGGTYRYGNLQLLCQSCNSMKGDQPHEFLKLRLHKLGFIE